MRNISLFSIKRRKNSAETVPNLIQDQNLRNLTGKKPIKLEIRTKKAHIRDLLRALMREKSLKKTKKFENSVNISKKKSNLHYFFLTIFLASQKLEIYNNFIKIFKKHNKITNYNCKKSQEFPNGFNRYKKASNIFEIRQSSR